MGDQDRMNINADPLGMAIAQEYGGSQQTTSYAQNRVG